MVSVTADDSVLLNIVGLFVEPVEVYDAKGKLLGLFVPANMEACKAYRDSVADEFDLQEMERLKHSTEERYPFSEVRERLQQLAVEADRRQTAGEPKMTDQEVHDFLDRLRANRNSAATSAEKDASGVSG